MHPVQAKGSDAVVRTAAYAKESGTFTVPARTVADDPRDRRRDRGRAVLGRPRRRRPLGLQ
ncbi:alpha-1,6-glucosidase domain-containing protein, partial [Streptomyces sp. NPDC006324]|uniref:alpha-1,6-glucosidase domain-containing protein n=1 Tax=Streptomyces sp. NPDC006324 TaxID=3156751 RepID=UPI0033AB82E3